MNPNDFFFYALLVAVGIYVIASLIDFAIRLKRSIKILKQKDDQRANNIDQPAQSLIKKLYQEHKYVLFVNPSNELVYYDKTTPIIVLS